MVRQYERAAHNAREAGFDGVEVHGANGYLPDQFLETRTNQRTDNYGGPVEHRSRLLLEIVETTMKVLGADRVGVRLSPLSFFNDMADDDPEMTFGYAAERLNEYGLAYLHVINPATAALEKHRKPDPTALRIVELIRDKYRGTLMLCGGFDRESAEEWLQKGRADLIAFGRKFIANPDLPERFRRGAPLNIDDPATYYGGGERGYTDYLSLAQERGEQPKPCMDANWR